MKMKSEHSNKSLTNKKSNLIVKKIKVEKEIFNIKKLLMTLKLIIQLLEIILTDKEVTKINILKTLLINLKELSHLLKLKLITSLLKIPYLKENKSLSKKLSLLRRDRLKIYKKELELVKKDRRNYRDRMMIFEVNLSRKIKRLTKCLKNKRKDSKYILIYIVYFRFHS